jgi:hypothetical protein
VSDLAASRWTRAGRRHTLDCSATPAVTPDVPIAARYALSCHRFFARTSYPPLRHPLRSLRSMILGSHELVNRTRLARIRATVRPQASSTPDSRSPTHSTRARGGKELKALTGDSKFCLFLFVVGVLIRLVCLACGSCTSVYRPRSQLSVDHVKSQEIARIQDSSARLRTLSRLPLRSSFQACSPLGKAQD